MPFGLPSISATYQRDLRRLLAAQEARHHAVMMEMETVLKEPPKPQSLLRLRALVVREEQPFRRTFSCPNSPSST